VKHYLGLFFLLFSLVASAQKVEVTSDSMEAIDAQKRVRLMGNVHIHQGENHLYAKEVIVSFDANHEAHKYEARGGVSFTLKENRHHYKGYANVLIYYPQSLRYILVGKASVEDKIASRRLTGERIVLNMKNGNAKIDGNHKKPVKFIFEMEKK
jgi:lipopolysaccharide export system protein LptA